MANIVLSAAVRQNLLSLQSTASLLATTQNDLATGNKVNSALDNPTSFFTAQSLNNRASDINNLLDGIGNGVQVLQAANTGITSLQSLVASAQSVANQVLQTPIGFSAKSSVTSAAITGATAGNLLGTGTPVDATFTSTVAGTAQTNAAFTAGNATGTVALKDNAATPAAITAATSLDSGAANHLATATLTALAGQTLSVNGRTLTFSATATATSGAGTVAETIGLGAGTTSLAGDITNFIASAGGGATVGFSGTGAITITTTTAADVTVSGTAAATLGISSVTRGGGAIASTPLTAGTVLSGTSTTAPGALTAGFANNDTLTVDGKTLTFSNSAATALTTNGGTINIADSVQSVLSAIDTITGSSGATAASITNGKITLHTGISGPLTVTSSNANALAALGLGTGVNQATGSLSALSGKVLTIAATGGGTATNITFGTANGQISTLNGLNNALAANNLQATIDTTGAITITTSNNAASSTIGTLAGTATGAGLAFNGLTVNGPVNDPNAQATRSGLVSQFNNILKQIDTTAQDSSFNGVNLLEADTLNLTFDETGKSTLAISGVTFNTAGLGLSSLTAGTDFLDSNSANKVLTSLNSASSTLRSEASNLGSNLSIVQVRQDFSKNLINVLQTGASNLTLADTNEEAANSQALSTRQSIAVSALALANQSQQSVLQLLR
jgi:hypothetical protein